MKNAVIYVHGKGGNAEEADHYKQFFDDSFEIIGFDYKSLNPWDAKIEFRNYFHSIISKYNKIYLIANSIGAYFSLIFLFDMPIEKAMLISPIVDMESIILNMMKCENVTEDELMLEKEIETSFGESLSWEYLSYVRSKNIYWYNRLTTKFQFVEVIPFFYDNLKLSFDETCYLEFSASDMEDIQKLLGIVNKHVYNKEDGDYVELVIE